MANTPITSMPIATSLDGTELVPIVQPPDATNGVSKRVTTQQIANLSRVSVYLGSGAPTLSAGTGSLYMRSDGNTTTNRAYLNINGSTTWVAIVTAT